MTPDIDTEGVCDVSLSLKDVLYKSHVITRGHWLRHTIGWFHRQGQSGWRRVDLSSSWISGEAAIFYVTRDAITGLWQIPVGPAFPAFRCRASDAAQRIISSTVITGKQLGSTGFCREFFAGTFSCVFLRNQTKSNYPIAWVSTKSWYLYTKILTSKTSDPSPRVWIRDVFYNMGNYWQPAEGNAIKKYLKIKLAIFLTV